MSTKPTALFVLGMHRSGTSVVTRALGMSGYSHGKVMMEPAEDNEQGFFEVRRIANLNDRMLDAVGMHWDNLKSLRDFKSGKSINISEYLQPIFFKELENAWDAEFGNHNENIIIKDPRFCLLFPLWRDIAESKGYDVKTVFVLRSPEDVARSLARRNNINLSVSYELWLRYNLSAFEVAQDETPIIRYQDFIDNPIAMLNATGLKISDETDREITQFVRPNLSPELSPKRAYRPVAVDQVLNILDGQNILQRTDKIRNVISAIKNQVRSKDEFVGNIYHTGTARKSRPVAQSGNRPVILHCHLFKNAGTSVDHILKSNFADSWEEQEFPTSDYASNVDLVRTYLHTNTRLNAFSTHTGNWTLSEKIHNTIVLPLIFIRHPITRVLSAYRFEKKQGADTAGSKLAQKTDFAGYVQTRLNNPKDLAFNNFQSLRLAFFAGRTITNISSQAIEAFERAPFIGSVENFDRSCEKLEKYLQPHFPNFRAVATQKNVTETKKVSLEEQLDGIRNELGDHLYQDLEASNKVDLDLYHRLREIYS